MDVQLIVDRAIDPAIATNARNEIVCCNQAARELFGLRTGGRRHHTFVQALDPRDVAGNFYNHDNSVFEQMIARGERIQAFELMVRRATKELIRVRVSVIAVQSRGDDEWHYAYILAPIRRRRRADEAIERLLRDPHAAAPIFFPESEAIDPDGPPRELTGRQVAVLRLLAKGKHTREIADELFISEYTVRTHVQNILHRLRVHSQVEAVSMALRHHLI